MTTSTQTADIIFQMLEMEAEDKKQILTEDIKVLHKITVTAKKAEYKSKKYYILQTELSKAKSVYSEKYGEKALIKFVTYETLKNRLLVLVGNKVAPKLQKVKFSKLD